MTLQTDLIQPVNNLHGDIDDAKQALFAAYVSAEDTLNTLHKAKPHARDYACPARYKDARDQYSAILKAQWAIMNYHEAMIPA